MALFLIAFFSCQKQFDVPLEATVSVQKVSVANAKAWVINGIPAHQLQSQGQILWDLAEETTFNNAPLLTVPMSPKNTDEQLLLRNDGKNIKSLVSTQRILFYLDAKGAIKSSIIKTENSENDNLLTYSGNLYFFDPSNGTAQAIWELKEGKFIKSTSFNVSSPNTRTGSCIWELYQVVCGDGCPGGAALGGADNGNYFPNLPDGCCYQYKGCGDGPGGGSAPSNPSPYTPIFNPNNPISGGGLGNGGILGGPGGVGGIGTGLLGTTLILDSETNQPSFDVFEIKVVGEESFSEENDLRLYRNPCDGYRYLIDKARNANNEREVGGMLTSEGLIVGPNSWGSVGNYHFRFHRIQSAGSSEIKLDYRCRIKGQIKVIYINTFLHSHPRGGNLSQADINGANDNPGPKRYVIFNDNNTISFREYKVINFFLD